MKKTLFLMLGLLVALQAPLFTSCSDDDDEDIQANQVPEVVMAAFTAKYPTATNVQWEKEGSSYKADFHNGSNEVDAWFASDGTWQKSETDLLAAQLPEPVMAYVQTNYADRVIDDCDLIETPTETYYLLELDKAGAADVYIKLTAAGELLP